MLSADTLDEGSGFRSGLDISLFSPSFGSGFLLPGHAQYSQAWFSPRAYESFWGPGSPCNFAPVDPYERQAQ